MNNVKVSALALVNVLALAGCLDFTHNDAPDPSATRALLEARDPPLPVDLAIVLGCPASDEDGALSLCERCRVKSAVRAYRAGEVSAIIFSGGAAHNRFVEAEVMGDEAVRRGVPPDRVLREGRALTTWMNLRLSQRIMRERGARTALIVSTADHLPRAKRFADWYGIRARYRACDLEPYDDE